MREQRTRTIFAQHGLRPGDVAAELEAAATAVGTSIDVERLIREACAGLGVPASTTDRVTEIGASHLPRPVASRLDLEGDRKRLRIGYELPVPDGVTYVPRTHPLVEALSSYVLDTALDEPDRAVAKRCGAIRTRDVAIRAVLLLLRARFLIESERGSRVHPMLAEECLLVAFEGDPRAPKWLDRTDGDRLARAEPTATVILEQTQAWLREVLAAREVWEQQLGKIAQQRAEELLAAHRRVRAAANLRGVRYRVRPHQEMDLLGVYVLMPDGRAR